MALCPVASVKMLIMAKTKCKDLLLCLLLHHFDVITHTYIFFDSNIIIVRNKNLAVCAKCQTLCDLAGIPLICFNLFSNCSKKKAIPSDLKSIAFCIYALKTSLTK